MHRFWGGADRVGTVLQFKEKTTLGTSGKITVKKDDFAVAHKHAGDGFFGWLIVGRDANGHTIIKAMHRDYWPPGEHVELGKITEPSLISLLHSKLNKAYGQGYLAITKS